MCKREMILRNRLEMVRHNLSCYSANCLCDTPKEGMEVEYEVTLVEIDILETWIKEFEAAHNPAKCAANLSISLLKTIDKSILKMAGGGIADKDKAMYLRAYSADIHGVIKHLETI